MLKRIWGRGMDCASLRHRLPVSQAALSCSDELQGVRKMTSLPLVPGLKSVTGKNEMLKIVSCVNLLPVCVYIPIASGWVRVAVIIDFDTSPVHWVLSSPLLPHWCLSTLCSRPSKPCSSGFGPSGGTSGWVGQAHG